MTSENLKAVPTVEPDVTPNANAADDPFDLTNLRLDQAFTETIGVKKLLTTVPVRKPNKQDFVRVHPSYHENFAVIDLKEDREIYLVTLPIAHELPGECLLVTLYTAINRQGVVHLWPVPLPASDGRVNEWHHSQAAAAERAMKRWIRVTANMSLGAYEMREASNTIPEPEWPDFTFKDLIRIGFRDRLVDRLDHPVIKRLRGLA